MKRITIYDVAKEADVSLATVSRVINDSNVVREDTRMRVQQAIEKLGYKPNAIAQRFGNCAKNYDQFNRNEREIVCVQRKNLEWFDGCRKNL
mgnify:CR=1 FL=1